MMEVEMVSKKFGDELKKRKLTIAIAESCTGGAVSHIITNTPGSSDYFLGGVVTYSDESKQAILGVKSDTLKTHGAVSAETVKEMAAGVRDIFQSNLGLSISGIAGPDGGTDEKPVGLVFIAVDDGVDNKQYNYKFNGDRLAIKRESCLTAMELILEKYGPE